MQSVSCERGDVIKPRTRLCENNDIEISVIDSGGGVSDTAAEKNIQALLNDKRMRPDLQVILMLFFCSPKSVILVYSNIIII